MEATENKVMNEEQNNTDVPTSLPNSTAVLVMGILSIVFCWFLGGIIGTILGIIALVLAAKSKSLYKAEPAKYSIESYKNLKAGYICAIIGLSLSALFLLIIIFYFMIVGAALFTALSFFS